MTAATPGQADAEWMANRDRRVFAAWYEANGYGNPDDEFGGGETAEVFLAGMQAARDLAVQQRPAPELAAAVRETRLVRDIVCKLLDLFGAPDQRLMQHASTTRTTLQRYAGEAGVRLDGRPS